MKKNKLPKWNLDEIYVGHNDPKIDKDLKKLSKLTNQFIDKWKGKIKNLSGKEISNCLKEYEKINEIMILLIHLHKMILIAQLLECLSLKFGNQVKFLYLNVVKAEVTQVLRIHCSLKKTQEWYMEMQKNP